MDKKNMMNSLTKGSKSVFSDVKAGTIGASQLEKASKAAFNSKRK